MAYNQLGIKPPINGQYVLPIKSFAERLKEQARLYLQVEPKTKRQWLETLLPIAGWLPKYEWRKNLGYDLMAGLAVGVMAVPQSFSYANLAGLPGVFGLYGMVTPVIIYALFGSSKQLGVGPVAVTSLLLGNGLNSIYGSNTNPNTPKNVALQNTLNMAAIQVCLLAGIMYTLVGAFRMSWIANFLSHSVVSGFMSGAAILIGLTQVKYIFGIKIPRADTVPENLRLLDGAIWGFKWQEFLMGMCWIITLMTFRAVGTKYPKLAILRSMGPVVVTLLALILMYSTSWTAIATVGKIPSGLPLPTFAWWGITDHAAEKFTLAVLICCIDLCESLSIAKALAQKNRQEISQTQEIIALGLANLSGACFNSYTTTGSFSRSAVNQSVGAKSQLSGLVTGFFMLFVLLVLTPFLSQLPSNIQGAVVIVGVVPLFDYSEWWFLWHANLLDFVVWNAAFIFTMIFGVETGIAVSVGLSLALIVFQVSFPHMVTLGKIEDSRVYRSTELYPKAVPEPGIAVVRVDAPIIFANFPNIRQFIRDQIITNKDLIEAAAESGEQAPQRIHSVIIDLSAVPYIDTSAIHLLHDLFNELKAGGRRGGPVQLMFANPTGAVIKQLSLGKFFSEHGTDDFFFGTHEAVEWAKANRLPEREIPDAPSLAFRSMGVSSEAKAFDEPAANV
jgi:sulfate transporter 4